MDAIEGVKQIPDNYIDCVWTDPPYNINYTYDVYEDKREDYVEWCRIWIKECYRVLKPAGSIFIKMWYANIPHICVILEEAGFFMKNIIIWKHHSQAGYMDRFLGGYETILFYTKTEANKFYPNRILKKTDFTYRWDDKKEYKGRLHDIWTDIKPVVCGSLKHPEGIYKEGTGEKMHPAQHPQEIVRRCIISTTDENDIVLDLFAGSGTVLLESKLQNRRFLGFEISLYFVNICNKRLEQQTLFSWVSKC